MVFRDADYELYLELLHEWCREANVPVLAYCLMPNHVHLVAVPQTEDTLTSAAREVHRRYSIAINRRKHWAAICGKAGMRPIP